MSVCAESVECVCRKCGAYKLKREWCEPCKICENYNLVPRKKCTEEKMREKELENRKEI